MDKMTLTATVDEHGRLILEGLPPGQEVQVELIYNEDLPETDPGTIEWVRARLKAVGLLAEDDYEEEEIEELSEEEEEELGRRAAGPRPVEDYVNEDREERF
jgi:hypothetical protein